MSKFGLWRGTLCQMQDIPQLAEQLRSACAVFRSVVQTVLPETAALSAVQCAAMERLVSEALRRRSTHEIRQIRFFLQLIEWGSVIRYGRRFTFLDLPRRVLVLRYLQDHPVQLVRAGFWGLRTLAFLGYYGQPEIGAAIGYRPDARGWEALR